MHIHPTFSVLFVTFEDGPEQPFIDYLQTLQPIDLSIQPVLADDLSPYQVIITSRPLDDAQQIRLESYIEAGGSSLALAGLRTEPLPAFYGVQPGVVGPTNELRVIFTDPCHPMATRLTDAYYFAGRYHPLEIKSDAVETILYADWRFTHQPVLTHRLIGNGQAAATTLQAFDAPTLQQILYRLLRQLAGQSNVGQTLGLGILGYSPAVGQLHGQGTEITTGLALKAACDLSPKRLAEARQAFPEISTYDSLNAMINDDGIDVVIIATPPNSHAKLALQLLEAGKHVICEKPLAFNQAETAQMIVTAQANQRLIACHQNRRWDLDYLAIKQAVTEGLIGELFYMETFVGSYNHPCGYWHSHDAVSGGTTYDWGAHYLDWVLSLMPDAPTQVIGTRQNRVWHDITNADQERVQLRFAGGQEAELIHSDIAAIPKPKWYLLGTEGAIVAHWNDVAVYELDPVLYYHEHHIPTTEMVPKLTLSRRQASGKMVEQSLAIPDRMTYPFHHNLADHLLTGEPLTVPVEESAQVVAVLEAAATSAEKGGTVEVLDA